jgi:hypothetical protein
MGINFEKAVSDINTLYEKDAAPIKYIAKELEKI